MNPLNERARFALHALASRGTIRSAWLPGMMEVYPRGGREERGERRHEEHNPGSDGSRPDMDDPLTVMACLLLLEEATGQVAWVEHGQTTWDVLIMKEGGSLIRCLSAGKSSRAEAIVDALMYLATGGKP